MHTGLVQALMELITSAGVVEALEVQKFIQDAFLIQGLAAPASCASGCTKNKHGLRFGGRERRFIWQLQAER